MRVPIKHVPTAHRDDLIHPNKERHAPPPGSFEHFVISQTAALRRIARHTRGEMSFEDVVQEAWIMAHRLRTAESAFNAEASDYLLSHLFQALVRYTETHVRHAVRLDHAPGEDAGDAGHPIAARLAAEACQEPLAHLISLEDDASGIVSELASYAGAWVVLVRHFDNRMRSVANFLRISVSQANRCRARAQRIATWQTGIALDIRMAELKPWRRRRAERAARQLCFDFGPPPSLFDSAGESRIPP